MRVRSIILTAGIFLGLVANAWAGGSAKSLLEEWGFPILPNSSFLSEGNIPPGKQLDNILAAYGSQLGLSDVKQVSNVVYAIDSGIDPQDVYKFYEPSINGQDWKLLSNNSERRGLTAVFYNEKKGMLYIDVDPAGLRDRKMTFMRVFGRLDPSKASGPGQRFPGPVQTAVQGILPGPQIANLQNASRIPTGEPISIPPSQRLHIQSARSAIRAQIDDRNTAEIRLASRAIDPGELLRVDDRLVLALTPKLDVDQIILPGTVPLLLELTEGSLSIPNTGRPAKLSIVATGAPVSLESIQLTSGNHTVKVLGSNLNLAFSVVQGGSMEAEVTSGEIMLILPPDASARLDVNAPTARVQNLTGVEPQNVTPDHMSLQLGTGRAEISLRAINGAVCIKFANR